MTGALVVFSLLKIWFHSCINLLFVLYPLRQSLFRDVVILCHRSIETSPVNILQNVVLFTKGSCFEFCLQRVPHVLLLKCFFFFFFNASISNVCIRFFRSETFSCPTQADILCLGRMKNSAFNWMVPLNRVLVKRTFFACKGATSSRDM